MLQKNGKYHVLKINEGNFALKDVLKLKFISLESVLRYLTHTIDRKYEVEYRVSEIKAPEKKFFLQKCKHVNPSFVFQNMRTK